MDYEQQLTDERAVTLLALLRDYALDGVASGQSFGDTRSLTVQELAEDLVGSLPNNYPAPDGVGILGVWA